MKKALQLSIFLLAGGGLFLFFSLRNNLNFSQFSANIDNQVSQSETQAENQSPVVDSSADIEIQAPLTNPPAIIKAIYSTGWSAGSEKKMDYFINLIKTTELNALVIDIKDYSGTVSYKMDIDSVKEYGADKDIKILKINSLIKKLHDEGIYVIARIAVFQDPILAKARPDLAIQSKSKGTIWKDKKGLSWTDPTSKEVWDYNVAIAKDALSRGFDEINFDYIRFASDGNMSDIKYPLWDGKTLKHKEIKKFFEYLRNSLPDAKLSVDIFGLVTINYEDIGVGQLLEDAFPYFDAIAPMVYPSHYAKGFNGYSNPAAHPYEVVYASMFEAQKRLNKFIKTASTTPVSVSFRPWLQDFDLGATYDADKIKAQIKATDDAANLCSAEKSASSTAAAFCDVDKNTSASNGWMLWSPSNVYTQGALNTE